MPTRRRVLHGALALGAALRFGTALARASQPTTPVDFEVPADACDAHTHIFADPAQFPMFDGRVYTPEMALPQEMASLHGSLHVRRVVIVTPSVYGTDNSATLYGMKARGADARGVAVIDERTSQSTLDALHHAGVRGVRINLTTEGVNDPLIARQRLQATVARAQRRHWHVQIFTNLAMIAAIRDLIAASPVPVVFDHFGGAQGALGPAQPGFPELVELVRSGHAYVKISGVYRCSAQAPGYADAVPLARTLIAANPERILWGTDWPHPDSAPPPGRKLTDVTPLLSLDDGLLMNLLPVWAPDAGTRRKLLVSNPARLYDFPA